MDLVGIVILIRPKLGGNCRNRSSTQSACDKSGFEIPVLKVDEQDSITAGYTVVYWYNPVLNIM